MTEQKYYVVGCTTPEAWEYVNSVLTQDGSIDDNIPARSIQCTDLKEHSPTRAVYLMTDAEAAQLSQHPDITFIHINQADYPELYPADPESLHCTPNRYTSPVKNYKNFQGNLPTTPNSTDLNRAGYQLLRSAQYTNPWQGVPVTTVINDPIPNSATGRNVDVIVGDDGCWFGHPEFRNNTGSGPTDYIGGNKLPGNGTCDLLDLVLDGPYYIDPDWFNANPNARLTTRWDGTRVPVESVARTWWSNSLQRSPQFASAGTVTIPSLYTRANCNGSNTALSFEGNHGTACASLAYGRTFGWAYNANKWFINAYGSLGFGFNVDRYFDVMKIFHVNKPINSLYGTQDPTISSNSWGWRATIPTTGFYYFRQGTSGTGGVAYTGAKPQFMTYLGSAGDNGRAKGEMVTNNLTTAGDELIAAGVIFVVAAGNSNQKQVSSSSPDFNNYWSTSIATPLSSATHTEFGSLCYNTTNRRGFPQQLGKYSSGSNVIYRAINIGALDDDNQPDGKERKVNYSDMGNEIDCYAPGDGTLAANRSYNTFPNVSYARFNQAPGTITATDVWFYGTSSACPVACGLIATALEINRSWTWNDVRSWLQSLTEQPSANFYQGPDPATATSADWADLNSLMGGSRRVIYNNIVGLATVAIGGAGLAITGAGLEISLK
jgi:hypothetical protein